MTEQPQISLWPELLKKITLSLPVRRSQVANWGVRLLKMNQPFCGLFMGQPMEIHPQEAASRSAYFLGFYERETTAWVLDYFRKEKPKMIVDIGANFGYFIYLANAELQQATIYAFEPDPYNMQWLERNLKMTKTSNTIHLEPLAISREKGMVKFVASDPNSHNNLWAGMNLKNAPTQYEIEVPTETLDAFCQERGVKHVDLVIMDIEGAEGFAVEGMSEGIQEKKYKNVLLEFHPEFLKGEYAPERLVKRFTDAGYTAWHFQSPYKEERHNDKTLGFYDLTWRETYLKKVDAQSLNLKHWEHILFKC